MSADGVVFVVELSKFYKSFLTDTINSIKILADIQKKHPNEYSNWVKIQKDPSAIIELSNRLDPESRKTLIDLFIRASALSRKIMIIYEMSIEEKNKLIKEIESFSESVDKNIKDKTEETKEQNTKQNQEE